ncbi:MAG: C10 family peptidase [Bacteroidales bacterium]|nr:C10 family peptidase [Bacteroidales bacterium]
MKKLSLLFGLMAVTVLGLNAGPVDQQKAQQLGTRFMKTTAVAERNADIQLNSVFMAVDDERGGADYYVFNVKGGNGFVIVAGDDRVKPILAYSTKGSFDPQDVAEGFEFTLNSFRKEIQYVREHNMVATPDIIAEWRSVSETGSLNRGGQTRAVVGPLCQTIWHQNYPYNSQCPEDELGHGGHVYAGCVATAMGQVMKFWDNPTRGTGSYTYNPEGYPQQTANFGETDYHFELMPLAIDSTSTDEEVFYIAQFLHHCGIAVDMQYGNDGSGAYSEDVPPALRSYFGYTCDDHLTNYGGWWPGYGYDNEEWAQMLKDGGLDENLPLYYSGSDDGGAGGHAFVCDGYDENDYFHFNWGWSGRDDAWCPIGALNTTKYAFNTFNGFTGHIIPNSSEYLNRPEAITDFIVTENNAESVTLSWTNPSNTLNGDPLGAFTITAYRDTEVIFTTNGEKGIAMEYVDNNLNPGLYRYSVIAENETGFSKRSYFSILVGEKCDITFVLYDEGGDGWKGAAISVTSEAANGQRIAVINMEEGSEKTVTVPLLRGNIDFIWNHGWYHTSEGYDTDYECSFTILDDQGNVLFESDELEDGAFMTYDNNCEHVGMPEVTTAKDIRVYPNPSDGVVTVEGTGRLTVLNTLGQIVKELDIEGQTTMKLPRGMYFVRLNGATQKVVVR